MAVGTIISKFQGTLQVPLFFAPYSVKVNPASNFNINKTGTDPLIGECYTSTATGSFHIPTLTSGEFIRLNYAGFAKGSINGGYDSTQPNIGTDGCVYQGQ